MSAAEVILVRHAEADRQALAAHAPVYAGARFDFVPLADRGVQQAHALSSQLRTIGVRLVLSSPYTRALHTAAIVAHELGCPLEVDLRLHDWLPVRDGTQPISREVVTQKIAQYERWAASGTLPAQRTWELPAEMRARLSAAVRANVQRLPIVVVTHEAPIRSVIGPVDVSLGSQHPVPLASFDA